MTSNPERELVITRIFKAPPPKVFKMFIEPEHLVKWWGPIGWSTTIKQLDARPGGIWVYCMKSEADGQESCGKAVYQEILPPERIVYTDYFADADGNPVAGMPESLVTLQFAEANGDQTEVTTRILFESAETKSQMIGMGMVEGMNESWGRLDEVLASA